MKFKLTHVLMLLLVVVILASSTIVPHMEGMGVRYEDIPEGDED